MIARRTQSSTLEELLIINKSSFVAVTGRRRVGKTYLIDQVYKSHMKFQVTGIQNGERETQIANFIDRLIYYSGHRVIVIPRTWQQVFQLLRTYLETLPKTKKHVIFLDELPWMSTPRSGFIQLLAHLWNDYLSKHDHFILVICGSATSWITKNIVNDKGGFHNRITCAIRLKPFTLGEVKEFFASRKVKLTDGAIAEIYMAFGGVPYYLEAVKRGESPTASIERLCFAEAGTLKYEYDNLYKAIFDAPEKHEAIVKTLAKSRAGMTLQELSAKSKVKIGGPMTRTINDLLQTGFIAEENSYGKKKRGSLYRLIDEYSLFYHRFIQPNNKTNKGIWQQLSATQSYKIWRGYAFENLCMRHIDKVKSALGISGVYTTTSSFRNQGDAPEKGYQIDILIDRNDNTINLCECKYYDAPYTITKSYASTLRNRKMRFIETTKTKKLVFNTFITNHPIVENMHSLDVVDARIELTELF